jgi:hypothetical protein
VYIPVWTPHHGVPLGVSKYIHLVGVNVWVRANKYYIYTSFRNILHIYMFVDTLLPKNYVVLPGGYVHTMCTSLSGHLIMVHLSACPTIFFLWGGMCGFVLTNTSYTHHSETYCTYTLSCIPFSQERFSCCLVHMYTRCTHAFHSMCIHACMHAYNRACTHRVYTRCVYT